MTGPPPSNFALPPNPDKILVLVLMKALNSGDLTSATAFAALHHYGDVMVLFMHQAKEEHNCSWFNPETGKMSGNAPILSSNI